MASKIGLSYKREAAAARLASAVNRLAARGVDVGSDPKPSRDPDANAVAMLDRTADVLEAAIARIDELKQAESDAFAKGETALAALLAERDALLTERDAAAKTGKAAKQPKGDDAAKGDAA